MPLARALSRLPLALALTFVAVCVALPLLVMLVETVWSGEGVSLAAWGALLRDPVDRQQLLRSLQLGAAATAVALVCGLGHTWLTERTDLPGGRWLGPLGVAPLVVPPIFVAMGFADVADVAGFWPCSLLLGVCYAPFVAVLAARGLRAVDGRGYDAALLARGRFAAERLLLRSIAPEVAAGCLFAFLLVLSEHGVPEFLTVKGKTWHTYAEGVFSRWTLRAVGGTHQDQVGAVVAAVPLVALVALSLWLALRLRAHTSIASGFEPLPVRRLGRWRWPALLLPAGYLGAGVGVPVFVMARWAAGSTNV
jgi:iron(III) transport system permease protein